MGDAPNPLNGDDFVEDLSEKVKITRNLNCEMRYSLDARMYYQLDLAFLVLQAKLVHFTLETRRDGVAESKLL